LAPLFDGASDFFLFGFFLFVALLFDALSAGETATCFPALAS
jgi:hypothetical protein